MEQEIGVADMILLDPLTEDALVENLDRRFQDSRIYVSVELCYCFTAAFCWIDCNFINFRDRL